MEWWKDDKNNRRCLSIHIDSKHAERISKLLARALNRNQILILEEASKNYSLSLTSMLKAVQENAGVPLSTLKLNAKILKDLELVEYGDGTDPKEMRLTETGKFVIGLMLM